MRRLLAFCAIALLCLSTACATPISKTLGANPDGSYDTANPCVLTDRSDCKSPAAASLAWTASCLTTALASISGIVVGTATDFSIDSCLTGTNAASATITFVQASDNTTSCFTDFSITGSSPNRKLHNAATTLGSGTCSLKATYMSNAVLSSTFSWNNVAAGGADASPPTSVTGISCTGGALSATCTFDAQMDPDHNVTRSGVASYKVYSDLAYVDSLAAATPGLTCDFTAQTIGAAVSGSPSATQGTGFSANQWTINARGYGVESADSYYGVSCPVSGSSVYLITRVDTLPNTLTYNKAHTDIRNGTSTTAAHYDCVIMRVANTYYLQRTYRTADGLSNNSTTQIQLTGSPPYYVLNQIVNNAGECAYSTDGGAWIPLVSNEPITLNASKIAVIGGSATTTGADDAATTVVFGSVAAQTAGRLSKTVTLTAGTHSLAVSSVDVTGNESALTASASVTVASGSVTHKWHPGMYVRAHTSHLSCGTACDAQRHALYAQILGTADSNIVGLSIWVWWKYLESDAGNDFTAGFSWLHNEINYIKANYPGKQIGLLLDFSPYGFKLTDANGVFPTYFVNAGCVYNENSAASAGGSDSLNWYKNDPICRSYFKRLIAAYGAEFDSETALEFVRIQQETDDAINNVGVSGTAEDAGWKDIASASVAAFPTTLIWVPMNWTGVETPSAKEALIVYYQSIGVGIGAPDTIPAPTISGQATWGYSCTNSTWPECIYRGLTTGSSGHDYCGEIVAMTSVELSEMGYHSIGGSPGLSAAQVTTVWNNQLCAQYGDWEPNFNEVTDDGMGGATQYWAGASGQKWAIDNTPLTHTSKPSGFN